MTDTVWKFPLPDAVSKVELPVGAVVLHVGEQFGQVNLWARVDPNTSRRTLRTFHVVGTGNPVPDAPVTFQGSAVCADGALVFHVFEETP